MPQLSFHFPCAEAVGFGETTAPVFVDEAIHPWRGRKWAHLFCEDIARLHGFALDLGLRRSWFQCPPKASWPHYDVTDTMRFKALRMGAVAADRRTFVTVARRISENARRECGRIRDSRL